MIALTGATGFLGRYITQELASQEQSLRCWYRPESDRSGFGELAERIEWLPGSLATMPLHSASCTGATPSCTPRWTIQVAAFAGVIACRQ